MLSYKYEGNILNDGKIVIDSSRFGSKMFWLYICVYIYFLFWVN